MSSKVSKDSVASFQ